MYIGLEGLDAALTPMLESFEFYLKFRGSETSVKKDLAKVINMVYRHQDLIESSRALLNHAHCAHHKYER